MSSANTKEPTKATAILAPLNKIEPKSQGDNKYTQSYLSKYFIWCEERFTFPSYDHSGNIIPSNINIPHSFGLLSEAEKLKLWCDSGFKETSRDLAIKYGKIVSLS
jgi:hypothetical protein